MGLLDGEIATLVGDALDFMLLDGTLRREVSTTVDSLGNPVLSTPATYTFRGFDDEYTAAYRAMAGIPERDIKIVVAGSSIATVPLQNDKVTIRGAWYQVRKVVTDPARAVYELQSFLIEAPT
jgi:hypothetical protein